MLRGSFSRGDLSWEIGVNFPTKNYKPSLALKEEPYQFIEIKQADSQTHILILFNRDYCVIKKGHDSRNKTATNCQFKSVQ